MTHTSLATLCLIYRKTLLFEMQIRMQFMVFINEAFEITFFHLR